MRGKPRGHLTRTTAFLVGGLLAVGCQGMDRLEPDEVVEAADASERGTILEGAARPDYTSGGRLTNEIAQRRVREITLAQGEERLALAGQFLEEYPIAEVIPEVHELIGDAYSELGRPADAAAAWERAVERAYPDIVGLPPTNVELPYEIGWAHVEAGDFEAAADWLARASFVIDRPQLDQGLRFVYSELGAPGDGFDGWHEQRREQFAVRAPDFELPGHGFDRLRLSELDSRLTLINFWSPT